MKQNRRSDVVRILSKAEARDNAKRHAKRLRQRNDELRKDVNKNVDTEHHDADHPDYGIGTHERMWKHHKWVDRKRDKNGKWIYDYGSGYGKPDRELTLKNNDMLHRENERARQLERSLQRDFDKDIKEYPLGNPGRAAQLYLRDFQREVSKAGLRISNLARRTVKAGQDWLSKARFF